MVSLKPNELQVHFVSCHSTGLTKFHRNVISFPQDLSAFVARHGLGRGYRVTVRVNSSRGPGRDLERRPFKAWEAFVGSVGIRDRSCGGT